MGKYVPEAPTSARPGSMTEWKSDPAKTPEMLFRLNN